MNSCADQKEEIEYLISREVSDKFECSELRIGYKLYYFRPNTCQEIQSHHCQGYYNEEHEAWFYSHFFAKYPDDKARDKNYLPKNFL